MKKVMHYRVSYDFDAEIENKISEIAKRFRLDEKDIVSVDKKEIAIKEKGRTKYFYDYTIAIEISTVKVAGWEYIGTLTKETGDFSEQPIISCIDDRDMSSYYNVNFRCDHCNTQRFRKTVHLFTNNNGEVKMVASTCVKDYFGYEIDKIINRIMNFHLSISTFTDEIDMLCGGLTNKLYDVEQWAHLCHNFIIDYGFTSQKNADGYHTIATVNSVNSLFHPKNSDDYDFKMQLLDKYDFDFEAVRKYWFDKKENDSTFYHNVIANLKRQQPKEGLLAYTIAEYIQALKQPKKIASKLSFVNSKPIGDKGDKIEINAVVYKMSIYENNYGISTIIKFISDGNL